jgi:type III secretory pathway component EscV
MVFAHVLVTEAELDAMAGELVDAIGWTADNKQDWADQASAYLCALARYDFVTNSATLNAQTKAILAEYIARYSAMSGIAYNMSSVGATFSSLIEPEDMIQLHVYRIEEIKNLIKDQNTITFIKS